MKNATFIVGSTVLSIALFLSSCFPQTLVGNRVTIIPHDFRGVVFIIYDEKTSARFETKENKITYRVPNSGVLRSFPPPSEHFKADEYYFEEPDGTLKPIRYLFPAGGAYTDKEATFDNIPADSQEIFCMLDSLGTSQSNGNSIRYRSFLVGQASEVDYLESQIGQKLREL